MRDLSNNPLNDDPGSREADPDSQRSLEHRDPTALVQRSESGDYRTELYARLRNIIDNATESIRNLKEENAALSEQNTKLADRIGMLEYRIRTVTTELTNDELALRKSAEVLEQVLRGTPTGTVASAPISAPPAPANLATSAVRDISTMKPTASSSPMPEPAGAPEPEPATSPTEQTGAPSMEDGIAPSSQPEPLSPVASDEDESEAVIASPRTNGASETYTLIASPFVRFSDLGQFQAALQKLTGIHDVQVRRFAQGTLEMRIGYSGATDLATTLRTLATEIEDVREEEPYQLRVRLRTSQV